MVDLGHLKDLEISKYKRESKAQMPIIFCCLIIVNCGLFSFLNIEKVKIYIMKTLLQMEMYYVREYSPLLKLV